MIRDAFYVKRVRAPKGTKSSGHAPVVLYARGFRDDTGNEKANIVLQVTLGSHPKDVRKSVQKLCDDLNGAWRAYYGVIE